MERGCLEYPERQEMFERNSKTTKRTSQGKKKSAAIIAYITCVHIFGSVTASNPIKINGVLIISLLGSFRWVSDRVCVARCRCINRLLLVWWLLELVVVLLLLRLRRLLLLPAPQLVGRFFLRRERRQRAVRVRCQADGEAERRRVGASASGSARQAVAEARRNWHGHTGDGFSGGYSCSQSRMYNLSTCAAKAAESDTASANAGAAAESDTAGANSGAATASVDSPWAMAAAVDPGAAEAVPGSNGGPRRGPTRKAEAMLVTR